MNEKDQEKIDLLLTGYLDGELSERQHTELKRLLRTYPALAEELKAQQRQKELLGALPVAKAPATLTLDVQAMLERKMILEPETTQGSDRWNACLLFARRVAAAAAMLLIPVGLLSLLIFHIMRPVELDPAGPGPAAWEDTSVLNPAGSPAPTELTFADAASANAGRLVLHTDQPIQVNLFVEKRIHLHQLLDQTALERESADKTVYEIACPTEQLARFVEDLPGVWRRCSNAEFTLTGEGDEAVVVSRIQPDQLRSLMLESNPDNKRRSAGHFARLNQQSGEFHPNPSATVEEVTPPYPVIAWDPATSEEATEPAAAEGPVVRFTLEVHRANGESN